MSFLGFPSLADFEAKDSLALWEAMAAVDGAAVADLAPEVFFTAPVISRQQAKLWAEKLKVT